MKHNLIFTGSGPILIIHTYGSITDQKLVSKLHAKGIVKFVAFELNGDELREKYGKRYSKVAEDVEETDDLRVLDYDGHRILNHFNFDQLKTQRPFFNG